MDTASGSTSCGCAEGRASPGPVSAPERWGSRPGSRSPRSGLSPVVPTGGSASASTAATGRLKPDSVTDGDENRPDEGFSDSAPDGCAEEPDGWTTGMMIVCWASDSALVHVEDPRFGGRAPSALPPPEPEGTGPERGSTGRASVTGSPASTIELDASSGSGTGSAPARTADRRCSPSTSRTAAAATLMPTDAHAHRTLPESRATTRRPKATRTRIRTSSSTLHSVCGDAAPLRRAARVGLRSGFRSLSCRRRRAGRSRSPHTRRSHRFGRRPGPRTHAHRGP